MNGYDTLSEMGRLEESGMKRSEAEAVVNSVKAAVAPLATSAELGVLREEIVGLREELGETRTSLREEISTTQKSLREELSAKIDDTKETLQKEMATKTDLAEMKYELHKETSALIWRLFKWQTTTALAITGIVLTVLYYFPPA